MTQQMLDQIPSRTRRPRGRPLADDPAVTREQIIEAALEAFAGQGFEAMSLRALARKLRVSHGLIYHYFGSKQILWEASIEHVHGAVRDTAFKLLDNISDTEELVAAARLFFREAVIVAARHPSFFKIALDESGRDGPRLQYLYEHYFKPINARWQEAITNLDAESSVFAPIDQRALFFLSVFGASSPFFAGGLARYFEGGDLTTTEAIEQHADTVASMILDGLRARPEDRR